MVFNADLNRVFNTDLNIVFNIVYQRIIVRRFKRQCCTGLLILWSVCHPVSAGESIDFIAEHLLESAMNINYQALPGIPLDADKGSHAVTLGFGQVKGGLFTNRFPQVSLQIYRPLDDEHSLSISAFYQGYQFSGERGAIVVQPSFGHPPSLPSRFEATLDQTTGQGLHYGVSTSWNKKLSSGDWLQFGLTLEILDVEEFRADFTTTNLSNNFSGFTDYAGTYRIYTPWLGYQFRPQQWSSHWHGIGGVLLGFPRPHQGFQGRFSGPTFDFENSTDDIGRGKHIPDPFLGMRYRFIYQPANLSVDLGGSLYTLLVEPQLHKGVKSPFYFSATYRF